MNTIQQLKKKLQALNKHQLNLFLQQQTKAKIIAILFAALKHQFINMTNVFQYDDKSIITMKTNDENYSNKNATFISKNKNKKCYHISEIY